MKITIKDITLEVLRFGGVGPAHSPRLVFLQLLGNAQEIRGARYAISKGNIPMTLYAPPTIWGGVARLGRGAWRVAVEPRPVQGVPFYLMTAFLPQGVIDGEEYFIFVTPGRPDAGKHDPLFRRWANEFTPYPVPPSLSLADLEHLDPSLFMVGVGKAREPLPTPWVIALKPQGLQRLLEESMRRKGG